MACRRHQSMELQDLTIFSSSYFKISARCKTRLFNYQPVPYRLWDIADWLTDNQQSENASNQRCRYRCFNIRSNVLGKVSDIWCFAAKSEVELSSVPEIFESKFFNDLCLRFIFHKLEHCIGGVWLVFWRHNVGLSISHEHLQRLI